MGSELKNSCGFSWGRGFMGLRKLKSYFIFDGYFVIMTLDCGQKEVVGNSVDLICILAAFSFQLFKEY